MSQIISIYNGSSDTIMELTCPKCKSVVDVNLPKFVIAINKQESFWCAHCWSKFTFKVELLDPRSPTLRATVHAEHKCPRCDGRGKVRSTSNSDVKCPMCNGAGIYNRSAGG